jgi:hypothetical protein
LIRRKPGFSNRDRLFLFNPERHIADNAPGYNFSSLYMGLDVFDIYGIDVPHRFGYFFHTVFYGVIDTFFG